MDFKFDLDDNKTRRWFGLGIGTAAVAVGLAIAILSSREPEEAAAVDVEAIGPEKISPDDNYAAEQKAKDEAAALKRATDRENQDNKTSRKSVTTLESGTYGLWISYEQSKVIYIDPAEDDTYVFELEVSGSRNVDDDIYLQGTLESEGSGIYTGVDPDLEASFELTVNRDTVIILADDRAYSKIDGIYERTDNMEDIRPRSEIMEDFASTVAEGDYAAAILLINSEEFQSYVDENGKRGRDKAGKESLVLPSEEGKIYVEGSDGVGSYTVRTQGIAIQAYEVPQDDIVGMLGEEKEEEMTQVIYSDGSVEDADVAGSGGGFVSDILSSIEQRRAGRKTGTSGSTAGASIDTTNAAYSYAELEALACEYYLAANAGQSVSAICEDNGGDGNVSIQVVDAADPSHILQYYFVNPNTTSGTDLDGKKVTLTGKPSTSSARSSRTSSDQAYGEGTSSRTENGDQAALEEDFDYTQVPMTAIEPGNSGISAVGYDYDRQILLIRFENSGSLYAYYNVPEDDYDGMLDTQTPGSYYNDYIRSTYRYGKME